MSEEEPEQRQPEQDDCVATTPAGVYEITQTDQVNAKLLSTFIQQLEEDPDRFFVEKAAQLDDDDDEWQE